MNQKKKAGDATIRSDVHNVAVQLATTYTSPVTAVTGSDGTATADLTVTTSSGVDVIPKMGASVYADTTAWCISDIATSGKIFAATSTNRAVYEATTICTTPTTQPVAGSGGGGTVVSAEGNLLTTQQATVDDCSTAGFTPAPVYATYQSSSAFFKSAPCSIETTATTTGTSVRLFLRGGMTSGRTSEYIPVTPGETITATVSGMSTEHSGPLYMYVYCWQADGVTAATPAYNTSSLNGLGTGAWATLTRTFAVPADASYVSVRYGTTSAPTVAGQRIYWDNFGIWRGTGGQWAPPGQPIYQ